MAQMGARRILAAATIISFALLLASNVIAGVQDNWIEQIARHLREEKNQSHQEAFGPAYDRYLAQLQVVQQALQLRDTPAVKKELNRLIQMIAVREGGISQSSALSLIFDISEVTPPVYHDETMKSHFLLVRRLFISKAQVAEEPPIDATSHASIVRLRTAPVGLERYNWLGEIRFHPLFVLGAGVLILVVVGGLVLLYMGLRGSYVERKSSIQIKPKQLRLR
jgi:hypothetical protein